MKLYTLNGAHEIESVDVLRETPKRYYVGPHRFLYGSKFVRKDSTQWFPERDMALQWMREILKKRILYIEEDLYELQLKKEEQVAELSAFDDLNDVVDADGDSEESFWMQLQREGEG